MHDPTEHDGIDPVTRAEIAEWAKETEQYWASFPPDQPVTDEQLANEPKPPRGTGVDVAAMCSRTAAMAIEYFRTGKLGEPVEGELPEPSVESKMITAEMIDAFLAGHDVSREESYRRFAEVWTRHMGELQ